MFRESTASRHEINKMKKSELKSYLESRGYFVDEEETIKELRDTALDDWKNENPWHSNKGLSSNKSYRSKGDL